MEKKVIIHIFGSTGDLAYRKLLPAIAKTYTEGFLPKDIKVLAIGRRDYNNKEYLNHKFINSLKQDQQLSLEKIVEYYKMQITDSNDYLAYHKYLSEIKDDNTLNIFYLALAPHFTEDVVANLSISKILKKGSNDIVVIEKPFGNDLLSSRNLNNFLSNYLVEEQIYRIDHYLGKEMLRNLLTLRFTNPLLKNVWNNNYLDSIKVYLKEEVGILSRGDYYDKSGAIKDMVQSHLLQVVSLLAMEEPVNNSSKAIKKAKEQVLNNIEVDVNSIIKGQYAGYLDEEKVSKESKTETFISFTAFLNNERFKNVPFYLLTGKKLAEKRSFIELNFKKTNSTMYNDINNSNNKLLIEIDPRNYISLKVNSRELGIKGELTNLYLNNLDTCSEMIEQTDAYEKLFVDLVNENQTLFASWKEIEKAWEISEILLNTNKELIIYNKEEDIIKKC